MNIFPEFKIYIQSSSKGSLVSTSPRMDRYRNEQYESPESYYLGQEQNHRHVEPVSPPERVKYAGRDHGREPSRKPSKSGGGGNSHRSVSKSREGRDAREQHEMHRGYSQQVPKSRDDLPLALMQSKLLKTPNTSRGSEVSSYTFLPLCATHQTITKRPSTEMIK